MPESTHPGGNAHARIVTSLDEFLRLRESWAELLARSPFRNPFATFEWMEAWLSVFGECVRLLVVVVERKSGVVAIAPLCVQRDGVLTFVGYPQNDYADILCEPDDLDALACVVRTLGDLRPECRRMVFDQMRESASWYTRFLDQLRQLGLPVRTETADACPAMVIEDPEAARRMYYKRNISTYVNWFSKAGAFSWNLYSDTPQALERLEDLFEQHVGRWQDTLTPSYFRDERMREFYRAFVARMHPRGWVQFSSLTLDGRFLVFYLAFEYENRLYLYKTSYNPEFAKRSPGQVILRYVMDYALAHNICELDFARGDEGYKDRFANIVRHNRRVIVYRNNADRWLADTKFRLRRSRLATLMFRNRVARWAAAWVQRAARL